jgi:ubiquinone/menaquinone biosynthesis C-methylase UbiE
MLPIRNNSVDRVIAFESAQHFKPLIQFIQESNRVLDRSGLVVLAMPVITNASNLLSLPLADQYKSLPNREKPNWHYHKIEFATNRADPMFPELPLAQAKLKPTL